MVRILYLSRNDRCSATWFFKLFVWSCEENCTVDNSKILPSVGVTGFLPSTPCLPPEKTKTLLNALSNDIDKAKEGAVF